MPAAQPATLPLPGHWYAHEGEPSMWYCTRHIRPIPPSFFCFGGQVMAEECARNLNMIFTIYGS